MTRATQGYGVYYSLQLAPKQLPPGLLILLQGTFPTQDRIQVSRIAGTEASVPEAPRYRAAGEVPVRAMSPACVLGGATP